MALLVRLCVVVEYHGYPNQWLARYLLAITTYNDLIIVTPSNDMYDEDLGSASAEIAIWRARPAGAGIPFGLNVSAEAPCSGHLCAGPWQPPAD